MSREETLQPVVFTVGNNQSLKITQEVVEVLMAYRQIPARSKEAGGILIGRYLEESSDVVVDFVTAPMKYDRRTRFSFYRHHEPHQSILESYWKNSNGVYTYLGEWHTHPEPCPNPSGTDLKDWNRRLRQDTYHKFLSFIIVGTENIRCWSGSRTKPLHLCH